MTDELKWCHSEQPQKINTGQDTSQVFREDQDVQPSPPLFTNLPQYNPSTNGKLSSLPYTCRTCGKCTEKEHLCFFLYTVCLFYNCVFSSFFFIYNFVFEIFLGCMLCVWSLWHYSALLHMWGACQLSRRFLKGASSWEIFLRGIQSCRKFHSTIKKPFLTQHFSANWLSP